MTTKRPVEISFKGRVTGTKKSSNRGELSQISMKGQSRKSRRGTAGVNGGASKLNGRCKRVKHHIQLVYAIKDILVTQKRKRKRKENRQRRKDILVIMVRAHRV